MRPEAEKRLFKENGTDTAAWGRVDRDSNLRGEGGRFVLYRKSCQKQKGDAAFLFF